MNKITIADIHEDEWHSPKGAFKTGRKFISQALGAAKDVGLSGGGHPFEVELTRIPPGCANCPLHSHNQQWEFYIVVSGEGRLRTLAGETEFKAGEAVVCPPGEAHQIKNTGTEDLVYYVIADNPPTDLIHYPESGKYMVKPERKVFRMVETDYFDGEE